MVSVVVRETDASGSIVVEKGGADLGILHRPRQESSGGRRSPQITGTPSQWHPCLHREFAAWVFAAAAFFAVTDLGLDRNLERIAAFAGC